MATLADVARHAGVAASTVSYVLSGKRPYVSAATRRRVERSIELLGYHPHAGARALASHRSSIIALVLPLRSDLYVPVVMEIAIAVTHHRPPVRLRRATAHQRRGSRGDPPGRGQCPCGRDDPHGREHG